MRARFFIVGVVVSVCGGGVLGWLWWAWQSGAPPQAPSLPPVPSVSDTPTPPPLPAPSDEPQKIVNRVIDSGTLFIEARGQRLGTEEYSISYNERGEIVLRSRGTLTVKIALLSAQATFIQAMTWTAQRRPISYELALHGPLGIGNRSVSARFGSTTGIVSDGERQTEIALPKEPFLLVGMFSSYAILPLWAQPDTAQKLKVIDLRGERRARENWVSLEHIGLVQLSEGGFALRAHEYLLKGEQGTLKLYVDGERLLALQADTAERDRSFRISRSDLFPKGFDVLPHQN